MKISKSTIGVASLPGSEHFSFLPESAPIARKPPSFSVLFLDRQQDQMDPIQGDLSIFFEPSICGIIYNIKGHDTKVWDFGSLKQIDYEVVRIEAEKPPRLEAKGIAGVTLLEYLTIFSFHPGINYSLNNDELKRRQLEFNKCGINISLWENTQKAALVFLKKQHPDLAAAVKDHCSNETCAKALVVDTIRRTGRGPAGLPPDDYSFVRRMLAAQKSYKNATARSDSIKIDAHMLRFVNWARYHKMRYESEKMGRLVSEWTGTVKRSGAAIVKRAERLGLVFDARSGPR